MSFRQCSVLAAKAIGVTVAASDPISLVQYAGGTVFITSGAGLTTLTWYNCDTDNGTFSLAKDGIGNSFTSLVAPGQSCPIPPGLFGSPFVKAVGDSSAVANISRKT
jgi:hypothetical protein